MLTTTCTFKAPHAEIIADQDTNPASVGLKLRAFARSMGIKTSDLDWSFTERSDDACADDLDAAIATVGRRSPRGWTVGWHPDDPGTLMFQREEWF